LCNTILFFLQFVYYFLTLEKRKKSKEQGAKTKDVWKSNAFTIIKVSPALSELNAIAVGIFSAQISSESVTLSLSKCFSHNLFDSVKVKKTS
jgi:hypothetical protein